MVETVLNSVIIGALYHPPKPAYAEASLLTYLENCISIFSDKYSGITVILAGDFNSLSHEAITEHTALFEIVQKPTRGPNCLDRIYLSQGSFEHVKVTKSGLKSDHSAVLAYNGEVKVALNKCKQTVSYRPRTSLKTAIYREKLEKWTLRTQTRKIFKILLTLFITIYYRS